DVCSSDLHTIWHEHDLITLHIIGGSPICGRMWNRPETTFPRRNPTNRALTPNHDRFGIISLINSFKMKTKQAKDFLVQQTAEQAARESVPLSETEKKMMYFTESDATSCDNPVELMKNLKHNMTQLIMKLRFHGFSTMLTIG